MPFVPIPIGRVTLRLHSRGCTRLCPPFPPHLPSRERHSRGPSNPFCRPYSLQTSSCCNISSLTLNFPNLISALTVASTSSVTTVPRGGRGKITASFPPNAQAKAAIIRHFTVSSLALKTEAANNSTNVGFYGITKHATRGMRVTPLLLVTLGIDNDRTTKTEAFVATTSDSSTLAKVVIVAPDIFTGSTICMVSWEFAKNLPNT